MPCDPFACYTSQMKQREGERKEEIKNRISLLCCLCTNQMRGACMSSVYPFFVLLFGHSLFNLYALSLCLYDSFGRLFFSLQCSLLILAKAQYIKQIYKWGREEKINIEKPRLAITFDMTAWNNRFFPSRIKIVNFYTLIQISWNMVVFLWVCLFII